MTSPIRIKICGLRTKADVSAAVAAGASYLGFNFFPKSPRFVEFDEARALAQGVQVGVAKVGLLVNVDNELLDQLTATPKPGLCPMSKVSGVPTRPYMC